MSQVFNSLRQKKGSAGNVAVAGRGYCAGAVLGSGRAGGPSPSLTLVSAEMSPALPPWSAQILPSSCSQTYTGIRKF